MDGWMDGNLDRSEVSAPACLLEGKLVWGLEGVAIQSLPPKAGEQEALLSPPSACLPNPGACAECVSRSRSICRVIPYACGSWNIHTHTQADFSQLEKLQRVEKMALCVCVCVSVCLSVCLSANPFSPPFAFLKLREIHTFCFFPGFYKVFQICHTTFLTF